MKPPTIGNNQGPTKGCTRRSTCRIAPRSQSYLSPSTSMRPAVGPNPKHAGDVHQNAEAKQLASGFAHVPPRLADRTPACIVQRQVVPSRNPLITSRIGRPPPNRCRMLSTVGAKPRSPEHIGSAKWIRRVETCPAPARARPIRNKRSCSLLSARPRLGGSRFHGSAMHGLPARNRPPNGWPQPP
jgi:hypothetical protein